MLGEKRANIFLCQELDVVAPAYDHFTAKLNQMKNIRVEYLYTSFNVKNVTDTPNIHFKHLDIYRVVIYHLAPETGGAVCQLVRSLQGSKATEPFSPPDLGAFGPFKQSDRKI